MASGPIMLDTNVWLDFMLHRSSERAEHSRALIMKLQDAFEKPLIITTSMKRDVFYLIQRDIKHRLRQASKTGAITEEQALATRDLAWTMLERMDDLATIVPESMREDFFARHLRDAHDDYEDDLLIGTAQATEAQMVVTYDKALISHFPQLCVTPEDALARMGAEAGD